jgi:hypothetical protein
MKNGKLYMNGADFALSFVVGRSLKTIFKLYRTRPDTQRLKPEL